MDPMSNRSGDTFTNIQIFGEARAHVGTSYTIAQSKLLNSFGQYLYDCLLFNRPY
jgi:hypothetical protein